MRREGLRQQRHRLGKGDSSPSGAGGEYGKNLQNRDGESPLRIGAGKLYLPGGLQEYG